MGQWSFCVSRNPRQETKNSATLSTKSAFRTLNQGPWIMPWKWQQKLYVLEDWAHESCLFKNKSTFYITSQYFRRVGDTEPFASIDLHPSNELTQRFVLQGLQKFTSYQVVAQAYNKQGLGPSSDAAVATTMEDGKLSFCTFLIRAQMVSSFFMMTKFQCRLRGFVGSHQSLLRPHIATSRVKWGHWPKQCGTWGESKRRLYGAHCLFVSLQASASSARKFGSLAWNGIYLWIKDWQFWILPFGSCIDLLQKSRAFVHHS